MWRCISSTCLASFATIQELLTHISEGHQNEAIYVCNICDLRFTSLQLVGQHQQNVHSNNNQQSKSGQKEISSETIRCPICQRTFVDRTRLQRHVAAAHSTRTHTCDVCTATFRLNIIRIIIIIVSDTTVHYCCTHGIAIEQATRMFKNVPYVFEHSTEQTHSRGT